MDIPIETIGIFGVNFSRDLDQTWLNLWRKEDGYSLDLFQLVEDEEGDYEPIETMKKITLAQGEELLARIFEEARIAEWQTAYTNADGGEPTDLSWTLDIDDLEENDLFFSSGNGTLPPKELLMPLLAALRQYEPTFAVCFDDLK